MGGMPRLEIPVCVSASPWISGGLAGVHVVEDGGSGEGRSLGERTAAPLGHGRVARRSRGAIGERGGGMGTRDANGRAPLPPAGRLREKNRSGRATSL